MIVASNTNIQVAEVLNKMVQGDKMYVQSDYIAVGQESRMTVYPYLLKDLLLPYITLCIADCTIDKSVWVIRKKYIGV